MIKIIIIYYKKIYVIIIWALMGYTCVRSNRTHSKKLFVFENNLIFGLDLRVEAELDSKTRFFKIKKKNPKIILILFDSQTHQ